MDNKLLAKDLENILVKIFISYMNFACLLLKKEEVLFRKYSN